MEWLTKELPNIDWINLDLLDRARRSVLSAGCLAAAVAVIYRGNTFTDSSGYIFVVPVMCALTALALGVTAIAVGFGSEGSRQQ